MKKSVSKPRRAQRPPYSLRFTVKEEKILKSRAKKLRSGRKSVARVIKIALGFEKDTKQKAGK